MALLGSVGPFDRETDDWKSYWGRLQQFFVANEISDKVKQRAVFLSVCGSATYQLIRSLVAPGNPADKELAVLVKLVEDFVSPPSSSIVQRFHFNSRVQKDSETIMQYVAELRKVSEYCEFGTTLDSMLRDRLVCGVRDVRLQRRLLAESNLTFSKALDLAVAAELAEKNVRDLQNTQTHTATQDQVHAVDKEVNGIACHRCGGRHMAPICKFKTAVCHSCGKVGHLARVCRSKAADSRKQRRGNPKQQALSTGIHQIPERVPKPLAEDSTESDDGEERAYTLFALGSPPGAPLKIKILVNGALLEMEIDTGAALSIIGEATYKQLWAKDKTLRLSHTSTVLRTYTGEKLIILGRISVRACYKGQAAQLSLLVVKGDGPSLMGRDWLCKLKPDLSVFRTFARSGLQEVLDKHAALFKEELGLVKGLTVKFRVDSNVRPIFCKHRTVPYALRGRVEDELNRLVACGVLEPVPFSDWAAPVVPIVKQDGRIRICGDFKLTINQVAHVETYPLPRIEDLLASLGKGKLFSKLDLADAYLQLALEEDSKKYVTISTHKGLYHFNRLPFGVASAPAIFQRTIESLLQGISNISVYIDDILVSGSSEMEHLQTLEQVMTRLEQAGMRLKKSKCAFLMNSVEYLGHCISADGIRPSPERKRAVIEAPAPQNLEQLRSFLGLVNYYGKFLPNLANTLSPLYRLLQKNVAWSWGDDHKRAFQTAKSQLTSADLLTHFDPDKKLILSCDASPYGVGAVLAHELEDGSDRPIAYASRTLAPAERKYPQIEKEGLAVVFGVKKFHHYLLGRTFTVYSDHKPLQFLFSEKRPVPAMASSRIQRWALTLSAYSYQIKFRPGKEQGNADCLSRLPLAEAPSDVPVPGDLILMMGALADQESPVTFTNIKAWTGKDPLLSHVRHMILHGWQEDSSFAEKLQPFTRRKDELSVQDECILWGHRVVIPPAGVEAVIRVLHDAHPGIHRMKALARSMVWWPGIDADLETKVKQCAACQANRKSPPEAPLHPWEWPSKPWSRLHVDFAGPFMGRTFLILVDAHSKWLEVVPVSTPSSQQAIKALRHIFSTHGLPEVLVTDNGSAFTSMDFATFVKRNGFRHIRCAPYHPASNGLAERAVQTFKEAMKKMVTGGDLDTHLSRFLFQYRLTPHSTTGHSPAELLFGRKPRSHLDFLFPEVGVRVRKEQERQKKRHDEHTKTRTFRTGDLVYARNFSGNGPKWISGKVVAMTGPVSMVIILSDGQQVRRHIDHVRARGCEEVVPVTSDDEVFPRGTLDTAEVVPAEPDPQALPEPEPVPDAPAEPTVKPTEAPEPVVLRRSTRVHRPPDRL